MAFVFSISIVIFNISAQEKSTPPDQSTVEYVIWFSQFPSKKIKEGKKSFINIIFDFLFGKEAQLLSKPISVVAESPFKYWAIDQKKGSIIYIEEGDGKMLKFKTTENKFLSSLTDMCFLTENKFLLSDSRLNEVFLFDKSSNGLSSISDSIIWQQPTGLAHSESTNEIWVVETAAHRISIINESGERLKILGERGIGPGEFNFPTHIWIDQKGFAYVVDAMNFRIQIFDKEGEFVSMFGKQGDGTGFLARPKGIATDSFGNIYVVDALFNVVQIFNQEGQLLYYFGGQGKEKGLFWMPNGIFIDRANNIFVSDTYNSRIQVFKLKNVE